ncbi:MAG: hypothetical protein ABIP75_18980 [Pyrinomonadaceae bacterium]
MKTLNKFSISALCFCLLAPIAALGQAKKAPDSETKELVAKIKRFAPTVVTGDARRLTPGDRRALEKIIEAAKYLDPLFLRQMWSGNEARLDQVKADKSAVGRLRYQYYLINDGPWSQLDGQKAFLSGVPEERPAAANYYPADMTKGEFDAWVATLSPAEREKATGFFVVIRRDNAGKLINVPYSQEYHEFLIPAAGLLREAAALTTNESLRNFLTKRADAFISNVYYDSDVAWMDLDAPIEVTIGPYETYSDGMYGYKAAFEAYVTLKDEAESAKLTKFSQYLQELEDHLPIEPRYRNPQLGPGSPIRVVNEVFGSGEGNSGVQTAAFNLPNDEKVVNEKGSKRVMLRNVQEAKFNQTLVPLSKLTLSGADQKNVSFEAFFTHILCHELMHGLGPHQITLNGQATSVRQQLKETYSTIEEAKADITGLWALQYLIDKGVLDKGMETKMYTTYLASVFRSVRFGITEAHGRGIAIQFNYLTDEGAIKYNPATKTFSIVPAKIKAAVAKLTGEILTLQAEGSYAKAAALREKYGVIRPNMQAALNRMTNIPVDIEPVFPLANSAGR